MALLKPTVSLRYTDDTILWPHQEAVKILLDHVNLGIQFTMEENTKS